MWAHTHTHMQARSQFNICFWNSSAFFRWVLNELGFLTDRKNYDSMSQCNHWVLGQPNSLLAVRKLMCAVFLDTINLKMSCLVYVQGNN